jgi:hypothetical protein
VTKEKERRNKKNFSEFWQQNYLSRNKWDMDPPDVHSGQHCPFTTKAKVATGHGGQEDS